MYYNLSMRDICVISKPYIEILDKVKLCVNVEGFSKDIKQLWYEFPLWMKDYINVENSDAFLVALLPNCAFLNKDIIVNGKISKKLYLSINNELMPIWKKFSKIFNGISVICDEDNLQNEKQENKHIGTAISCGVDSLNTYFTLIDEKQEIDTLTFLMLVLIEAQGGSMRINHMIYLTVD